MSLSTKAYSHVHLLIVIKGDTTSTILSTQPIFCTKVYTCISCQLSSTVKTNIDTMRLNVQAATN